MISRLDWEEFLKAYTWQLLKNPDYRLGQAFLNYYTEINQMLENDGDLGRQLSTQLFYEKDLVRTYAIIGQWIET